jgi:hypothetical protein
MLAIRPLTPARWKDLEALFGERGACGGCWCMFWRRPRSVFERQKGNGNRQAFRKLMQAGEPLGLIAYEDRKRVGWCAVAPRADYARRRGGSIVEGYPVEPRGKVADAFICTGLASAFRQAGFKEVARRSKTRPIMRRE